MATLIVKDTPPYDGTYEFEDLEFTFGELHRIKKMTGLRRGDFMDAISSNDSDLDLAFATIVLERHGHTVDESVLWAAKPGSLTLDFTETESTEDSPAPLDESTSGGASSSLGSGSQENGQSPTGGQPSDTSATSAPATSPI